MLKSNSDSQGRSRVQPPSKFKVTRSRENQSKNGRSSSVASVNLPVYAKCEKSVSVKIDKTLTKKLQCSPPRVGFVCPTANRFASLALDIEEQNNDCELRVETNRYSNANVLKSTKHSVKICKSPKTLKKNIQ